MHKSMLSGSVGLAALTLILVVVGSSPQQTSQITDTLPTTPQILGEGNRQFRVVPVVRGLIHPWAFTFLPNTDILINERPGRVRVVRNGVLDPKSIEGVPRSMQAFPQQGLWDIALHPRFAENGYVYLTYAKQNPSEKIAPGEELTPLGPSARAALARGRFDGKYGLTDVKDIFVSNWSASGSTAARIAFAPDGKIFLSIGVAGRSADKGGANRVGSAEDAQNPALHGGKVLRLNDDGSVPSDNPFFGKAGYAPEVYSLGHRTITGLAVNPQTRELWAVENGPNGGDELNIVRATRNYGWPVISLGRAYNGERTENGGGPELAQPCAPGMEQPLLFWSPVIAPSGLMFYTGTKYAGWMGHLFIGGMRSGLLTHIGFTRSGQPDRGEEFNIKQRIRDVRQGPDGLLYLLTEGPISMGPASGEPDPVGALLRIEPLAPAR